MPTFSAKMVTIRVWGLVNARIPFIRTPIVAVHLVCALCSFQV